MADFRMRKDIREGLADIKAHKTLKNEELKKKLEIYNQ